MLTFKRVDYGYPDQTNFGIFTKQSINKGVVDIYSGICFIDRHPRLKELLTKSIREKLSKEEIENIVCPYDYTSIHNFLLEQYTTLKSSEIKTPENIIFSSPSKPNSSLGLFPCNKTYTPIHFVNSCNFGEEGNIELEILDLGIDKKSGIHKYTPCYITTQHIPKGSELLDEYITDIDSLNDFQETAEDEIKEIKAYLNGKQSFTY